MATENSTPAPGAKRTAAAACHPTVLQVLPALGAGGGVERGTMEIAQAIVGAGWRSLVVSSGGPMAHEFTRVGAQHFILPLASKNPLVMRANIQRLADLMDAEDVDIVHARSRAPAWSSYFAARQTGRRFVTTFHGTYSTGNWVKRRYNSVMIRGERVIAISAFIAGHVRRVYGVPASRIRVIHRGVDLERFDPARVSADRVVALANQWRLPDGMPVVMLPGRLTRWKGQTVFIEAIAKLGRHDIRALLVGSEQNRAAYRSELEALVEHHGLGDVVHIVDHCKDMPAAYMMADVVVSASTNPEAFGRVIPEAQALGRPVVATDHGGARETVIPNETGWLTSPGDTDALAAAVERVLCLSAAERSQLVEKSLANVRDNFTRDAMCAKTLDVYNEVLSIESPA
ncbi:MAG TPA: glycosyltransferase family 4 protein [Rhodospirillales bacterium]|nr:glycosyltransferase family 4 protein [Rhodospirillales bacterium]